MSNRIQRALRVLLTGKSESGTLREVPPIHSEDLAEIRQFFPMPKFFIFGHARSGTTLLARLVRVHPDVHCNWQAHFFTRPPLLSGILADKKYEDWLARRSNRWNRGRDMSPVALRAMSDYILERDALREGKRVVGDKSPNVLLGGKAVSEMHRLYPDGSLINIVRDGRDTLISHRFQNFIDGVQFLNKADLKLRDEFAKNPEPFFAGERSVFTPQAVKNMAKSWAENVSETDKLGHQLYGARYFSLRYEDLLARPYEMLSKLWSFLGVNPDTMEARVQAEMGENPDADWQSQKAPDLAALLEKGKRGSWKQLFTERDKQLFKEAAGAVLQTWGYEQGGDW
ncbi:MAG: sulfotransferase [Anaerolineales bacterium]|nr:sulfotransferase [Anaerolineales bacterium]MCW5855377.1 sulfotransferase [Anaerolineales bacterium]